MVNENYFQLWAKCKQREQPSANFKTPLTYQHFYNIKGTILPYCTESAVKYQSVNQPTPVTIEQFKYFMYLEFIPYTHKFFQQLRQLFRSSEYTM